MQNTFLIDYGWHCYKLADTFKASQNKEKGAHKDRAEEIVWLNYELLSKAEKFWEFKEYNQSDFKQSG